jgi:hypothetical protein
MINNPHPFPSIPNFSSNLSSILSPNTTLSKSHQFPIFPDTSSLLTSQAMVPMGTLSKGTALPTKMGASAEEITFEGTCMDQWNS